MPADPSRAVATDAADAAAAAVDADELLSVARALLAARSENPGGSEDDAAAVAADVLAGIDADPSVVRSDAGRPSVVARIGGADRPALAWNGHLDTVPAGDHDAWTHPPFGGVVDGGRLVGRGAADMKGPIASALAAGAAIRRTGIELGGSFVFHLAADEEVGGLHGTKVLLERGHIDQDAAIVGEPSELQVGLAERGGCWLTLTAHGKAAHGSTPHLGVNAITSMAKLLLRLPDALPDIEHPLVGRPSVNAALIDGGTAPNVVPERCVVDVDRRVIPGETEPERIRADFVRVIDELRRDDPDVDIDVEVREWTDAAEAPHDSVVADVARAALARELGTPPADRGFTGITDARFYINDASIPTVILGPGSLRVAHTTDESIAVDELLVAARAYARIAVGFLGT